MPVHAKEIGFTIDPPVSHLIILPGRTATVPLTITTLGDPTPASITFTPFTPTGTTGEVSLVDCTEGALSSCLATSWFRIASASGSLNAASSKDLPGLFLTSRQPTNLTLTVSVPNDTPSGDYPISTLITGDSTSGSSGTVQMVARVGAHIIVTVLPPDGHYEQSGKILSFVPLEGMSIGLGNSRLKLYDSFDAIPLAVTIQNTGNTLIKPSGVIQSLHTSIPMRFEIVPQYILGNMIRTLQIADTPEGTSVVLPKGFYVGTYTFETQLWLTEGSEPLVVEATFIALPMKLMVTLLIVASSIVGLKHRKSRIQSKQNTQKNIS